METEIKSINGRTVCDTTARAAANAALGKPSCAVVGQYLRVKAVDATGKVIELEAVDGVGGITAKIVDNVLVVTNEETEG